MVRFHALGAIELAAGNGTDERVILSRQKRLGLFAYLVLARPQRFHRRDELVALFWPELDQQHARTALRQALHYLRKTLGHEVFLTRGEEEIAVDGSRIRCDAIEMDASLDAGDAEAALALYRGPLLPGLHIGGSAELDRWLDGERDRFARRAFAAAGSLARHEEQRGDGAGAIAWARRAAELAPFDETAARTLIRLLDAAGASAEAIATYNAFALAIRQELELEPSTETRELIRGIREAAAERAARAADLEPAGSSGETGASAPPLPSIRAASVRRDRLSSTMPLAFATVVVIAYVFARLTMIAGRDPDTTPIVAVLPFTVEGSREFAWLREGLADLLSAKLDGAGALRAVDANVVLAASARAEATTPGRPLDLARGREVATRFGARYYVLGRVMEAGGRFHASASLYDAGGSLRGTAEARVDDEREIFALVEDLARRLVMLPPLQPPGRLSRLGVVTTESFPALKSYLDGERLLRAGIFDSAVMAYEHAVSLDTAFALAWYRMAVARHRDAARTGRPGAHERALAHSSNLAPRDRLLLAAFDAFQRHQDAEAERLYRELLSIHPDEIDAWIFLGETIAAYGLWRGRAIADARHAFERALALDSTHVAALEQLSWIAAIEERFDEGAELTERALALQPSGYRAAAFRMRVALTRRNEHAEQRALAELRGKHWRYINWAQRSAHFSGNLEGRMRVARLLTEPLQADSARRLGHTVAARYLLDRGRWKEALEELADVRESMPDAWHLTSTRHRLAPLAPVSSAELEHVARTLEQWAPGDVRLGIARSYYLGVIRARLGDATAADSLARHLDARSGVLAVSPATSREAALARDLASGVRAWSAWERGDARAALGHLDRLRPEQWWQRERLGGIGADAVQVWLRAEVLSRLGRDDEALRLYAPLGFMWGDAGLLAAKHLRVAAIHDRRGESEEAVRHYERFVEIWRECDPRVRTAVRTVERRLASLRRG